MSAPNELPTFESLRAARAAVSSSTDMLRVRWDLFGSLQFSIEVANDLEAGSSSSCSPYQQTIADGVTFHQISRSPATEPLVSSIIVRVSELEYWGSDWEEDHAAPGEDGNEDQVWVDDDALRSMSKVDSHLL